MKGHFDRIRALHTRYLEPRRLKAELYRPQQLPMFGLNKMNHYHIGFFFELMTSALFGGKLVDSIVELPEESLYDIKPDVEGRTTVMESKCIRNGHHLNLYNDQIGKYKTYQIMKPHKRISFSIWRHSYRNSSKHRGSIDELLNAIIDRLQCGIVLPLSVMLALWEDAPDLSRKYDEPWYCTCVRSPVMNDFIFAPKKNLERYRLNPNEYLITRYLTPPGLTIDHATVKPFPLIVIADRDPTAWIQNHNAEPPF